MLLLLLPHQQDTLVDENVLFLDTQTKVISLDLDWDLVLDPNLLLYLDLVLLITSPGPMLGTRFEPLPNYVPVCRPTSSIDVDLEFDLVFVIVLYEDQSLNLMLDLGLDLDLVLRLNLEFWFPELPELDLFLVSLNLKSQSLQTFYVFAVMWKGLPLDHVTHLSLDHREAVGAHL